ncbi:MAG: phosphoribosylamine--glycine ligase [Clostridia bacterium]|nr:phosphoribosylamine--glycine ligase [Clostridia bacterium]
MKVMVIGGGGREHAIVKKLRENREIDELYVLPGNGGMAREATCVPIGATDLPAIAAFAREKAIDYAVVTPDDPLVLGAVDLLEGQGVPCFGPNKAAAILEGSKAFAKDFMARHHIPTAAYRTFTDPEAALEYVKDCSLPTVIKADGLALGKGVVIAETRQDAEAAVRAAMCEGKFGRSGETVVIEEFLTGPEVSVLAFTDGKTLVPMVSSMDHKRALDGDKGLNTGGMGTVAPNPFYTEAVARQCMEEIFLPTIRGMAAEGRPFKGCLYFGLMLTEKGPKVIEYNCRFGDPETQVVLALLESDLFTVMQAVTEERLSEAEVRFADGAAACVILASQGYPLAYEKGFEISMTEAVRPHLLFAGAKEKDGKLYTSGGRVLGVVARGKDLREALSLAYERVEQVHFENEFYRRDIGKRALEA